MFGGIAVARNLLCIACADARGRVFLVDLEERRPISYWEYAGPAGGYADAGGVALGPDFSIWIADTRNDVVRRFTAFGKEVGRLGARQERAPGATRRDRPGALDAPRAVAVHDGIVFVACGERELVGGVQRFRTTGEVLAPLPAFGETGRRFGAPRGLWADPAGLWVADTLHGVVQRFSPAGRFVCAIPTARSADEASRPVAVLPLPRGDLLVADHGDRPGVVRVRDGGAVEPVATMADLDEPLGLARDDRGGVLVLDSGGERVHRYTPDLSERRLVVDVAEVLGGD